MAISALFFSHLKNILHFKTKMAEKTTHTIGPKLDCMAYGLENVSDEGPFSCMISIFRHTYLSERSMFLLEADSG